MNRRRAGYLLLFLAALLVQQFVPLRPAEPTRYCHVSLLPGETARELGRNSPRWDCSGQDWRVSGERIALRFAATPDQGWFVTRASDFGALSITVRGADGATASRRYRHEDFAIGDGIALMYAALPKVANLREVLVEIESAHFTGMIKGATLSDQEPRGRAGPMDTFVAILCGLLFAPIVFDLAYYRVMREKFFLWHAAAGVMMLTYTAVTGGVLAHFIPYSEVTFGPISGWSFSIAVACAAMFFSSFIEAEVLRLRDRQVMNGVALVCLGIALLDQLRPFPSSVMQPLFYALWLPVICAFAWTMVTNLRRGSRAANFIVLAWTPLAATGVYRIFSNIGFNPQPVDAFEAFYISITLEVMISALGVADRFLILKHDRDRARIDARHLAGMAEVDALTGLANRRAIDGRFSDLFGQGYTTIALLDIDHFKAINDSHGHSIGDRVLKAVAEAISSDADTLALRMGGEEFMLLLRGRDGAQRAEARRQSIPVRVAALVPGLSHPVTASMGLVACDRNSPLHGDFTALYAHCDRLLYEAKANGRNRAMQERLRGFGASRDGARIKAAG